MKAWQAAALVALGAVLAAVVMLLWSPAARDDDEAPAAKTVEAPRDGEVALDTATQKRLGIGLVTLAAAAAPVLETGFARALDIAPLAAIDSEIIIARAAATASAADAKRLAVLAAADQSASARAVEAARALAVADRARVELAVRRVALEFGPGAASLGDSGRALLIADIAAGRAALLRIDVPGNRPAAGAVIRINDGSATILGAAASVDPRLQTAGVLAILRGAAVRDAGVGRLLPVTMATRGTAIGVTVPRPAVLRWHGSLWVYRQAAPGRFERIELPDARPMDAGWFVVAGVRPGDRIVAAGAGALLAAERGSQAPAEAD